MQISHEETRVLIGPYNIYGLNSIKQGDALSPLLLNFALVHAIRKVQENELVII